MNSGLKVGDPASLRDYRSARLPNWASFHTFGPCKCVFTFLSLKVSKLTSLAQRNTFPAKKWISGLKVRSPASIRDYRWAKLPNWAVLGQIRFAILLFEAWKSLQPLFVLKDMHFLQQNNWTSSPRLKVRDPASLRDYRWAKLPNWAVLGQIRFAILLFEARKSLQPLWVLKEMHFLQKHSWISSPRLKVRDLSIRWLYDTQFWPLLAYFCRGNNIIHLICAGNLPTHFFHSFRFK